MSSTKVTAHQHRKKKYVNKERDAPFPVPIASITREAPSKNYWYQYTGQIQGEFVLVTHSGDISYLNRMGFFGKGLLSRGEPAVYKDLPVVHLPSEKDDDPDVVRVMRRRMYLKHMKWKKSHDLRLSGEKDGASTGMDSQSVASEDLEFDSDTEYQQTDCMQKGNQWNQKDHFSEPTLQTNTANLMDKFQNETSDVTVTDSLEQPSCDTLLNTTSANQNSYVWSWNEELSNKKSHTDSWETSTANQKSATASWDTMEADEDFWASEDVQSEKSRPNDKRLLDSVENEPDSADNLRQVKTIEKEDQPESDISSVSPMKKLKLCHENDTYKNEENVMNDLTEFSKVDCNRGFEKDEAEQSDISKINKGLDAENEKILEITKEKMETSEIQDGKLSKDSEVDNIGQNENVCNMETNEDNQEPGSHQPLPVHPYCLSDAEDNDEDDENIDDKATASRGCEYLVIDDSDVDDSTEPVYRKEKYTWLPVRKKEIFNFNEPLVLSFEEAYFLCYGLGCLTVQDENQSPLTLTDLWCRFCQNQQFLPRYIAYHYFRSKGWVPKPSILFGTDFLVYKVGPVFYHASYSVIVKTVYEGTYEEVEDFNRKFTWTSFFGLNRITEHVAKTLVYCYVIMPKDLTEEEKRSPECIQRFKVRLQTVQRWVSSQEREQDKGLEEIS